MPQEGVPVFRSYGRGRHLATPNTILDQILVDFHVILQAERFHKSSPLLEREGAAPFNVEKNASLLDTGNQF